MENMLDLTRVPREVLFILELLKEENEEMIQKNQEELCKDIDWDLFLEYAMHHRVFPLLHSKIKLLDKNLVPAIVAQYITEQYKRNTFRMLQLSAEMEELSKSFAEDGIKTIFLKGPAIAYDLYGDISFRTSTDLDFLIPIEDLDRAIKNLELNGYQQTEFIDSLFNEWKWKYHHIEFVNYQKNVKVEVHWRLAPGPGRESSFNELWARRRTTPLTKTAVHILGKEDLFHYLVTHGARHGWFRLRWLHDIFQMCKQSSIDWEFCYKLTQRTGDVIICGQALTLVKNLFNGEGNNSQRMFFKTRNTQKLAQSAIFFMETKLNLHSVPLAEDINSYYMKYLFSLKSNRKKILFFLNRMYPNHKDLKTLTIPQKYHFIYFLLHPFLWLWRKKNDTLFK